MDIRVLQYFLTVAREQSFTKAAMILHITQPTLSRQVALLEEELGCPLFVRGGKSLTLTAEGILLKRRALEITELYDKTLGEFGKQSEVIEGSVTIGLGESSAVEELAQICKRFREKYPLVQIILHTATADVVYEKLGQGLVDLGLFLEPVDTEGLDYVRLSSCDHWSVAMRSDDPLTAKEFITKEDLSGLPLILPERTNVRSEIANWFGKDFKNLNVAFISNLGTNAGLMAAEGLGYVVSIEGASKYWKEELLVHRRLRPEIKTHSVIAWRRNIPYSRAVEKFIEEINAFEA